MDSCASQPNCAAAIIADTGIKNSIRTFSGTATNKIVTFTVRDTATKAVISTSQTSIPSVGKLLLGAAGTGAVAWFLSADGAQTLQQGAQNSALPFEGGQLSVPYNFDVRFRPEPDS